MRTIYQPNMPLANQAESLVINLPVAAVYQAVIATVNGSKSYKLKDDNRILLRVSFQTKASLFSWGEIVTVQLEDRGWQTALTIGAQPKTVFGSQALGAQAMASKQIKKEIDEFLSAMSRNLSTGY